MKFYFCETCGKRITDQQVEEGAARDKKLKGVYCKECAVGVMTIEFNAITGVQLRESSPPRPQHTTPTAPVGTKGSGINMQPASRGSARLQASPANKPHLAKQDNSSTAIYLGIAALVFVTAVVFVVMGTRQNNRAPAPTIAAAKPPDAPARPASPVAPAPTPTTIISDPVVSQPVDDAPKVDSKPGQATPTVNTDAEADHSNESVETPKKTPPIETAVAEPRTPVQPAPEPQVPAKVEDEAQKHFASSMKEIVPLLRQNQFSAVMKLLDEKIRDATLADAVENLKVVRSDVAEIRTLRQQAIDALRAKNGASVSLKLKTGPVTGTIKADPARNDLTLALRDGPELTISPEQLDAADVDAAAPLELDAGKAADMRRRALLFVCAGDFDRANSYFIKAKDAGLSDARPSYVNQFAGFTATESAVVVPAAKSKPFSPRPHSASMTVLSTLNIAADDVVVHDQFAYCASSSENKILVIDIADPKNMSLTDGGAASSSPGPHRLRLQGKFLYVVEGGAGGQLEIFDAANAPDLTPLGHVALSSGKPYGLEVSGTYAYVLQNAGAELGVYDISKPTAPVHKGTAHIEHNTTDIQMQGRYVYTSGSFSNTGYFAIFDTSNASAPKLVGSTGGWQYPHRLLVQDGIGYWPSGGNKLITVNLSNPSRPVLTSGHGPGFNSPRAITGQGHLILAVDNYKTDHLQIYDSSTPAVPKFIRKFELGAVAVRNMAVENGYLFLATGTSLVCVDLSSNPLAGSGK